MSSSQNGWAVPQSVFYKLTSSFQLVITNNRGEQFGLEKTQLLQFLGILCQRSREEKFLRRWTGG